MDVRAAILRAGKCLLEEDGIAALTQLKVAKAAGVKQSHLTYYFPKRADLLLAIAEHAVDSLISDLSTRLEGISAPVAFSEIVGAAMIQGVPPQVIIGLTVAADQEPALRIPLLRLIKSVRGQIQAILERLGQPEPANTALLIHATIAGLALLNHAQQTSTSAQEMKCAIAEMFRHLGL